MTLPRKIPTTPSTLPHEAIPVVNTIQEQRGKTNEHGGAKNIGKAEIAKESKKANESNKGGKKKDSAPSKGGNQHINPYLL